MLSIKRSPGEALIIGRGSDEVRVTVVGIETEPGRQVRLAIDAPTWIPVDREEIRMLKEKSGTVEPPVSKQGHSRLAVRRRSGEAVVIGHGRDEVRIEVARFKLLSGPRPCVQLLVDGPRFIPIDREEVRFAKLKAGAQDQLHIEDLVAATTDGDA